MKESDGVRKVLDNHRKMSGGDKRSQMMFGRFHMVSGGVSWYKKVSSAVKKDKGRCQESIRLCQEGVKCCQDGFSWCQERVQKVSDGDRRSKMVSGRRQMV